MGVAVGVAVWARKRERTVRDLERLAGHHAAAAERARLEARQARLEARLGRGSALLVCEFWSKQGACA